MRLESGWDIGLVQGVMPILSHDTETIKSPFVRTAADVAGVDFLPTVHRIRSIYIPGGDETDYTGLVRSLEALKDGSNEDQLADWMMTTCRDNVRTVLWWSEFAAEMTNPAKRTMPIAYKPSTADWDDDIRQATIGYYDRLKLHPWEGSKFDQETESTTRTLWLLTKFFRSGGVFKRQEAMDLITWEMLKQYGLRLNRRLDSGSW